ncbi:M1 family metallopeptidase [Novosphingobium album (ex Hu et al. 2023)]|uniref:Aminopeptidase n=1 Tax=Novosphingobium album (ex Hu et al. 2023) TaxID=2930093 RepID=A0ABT0B0P5_9SPHN|nr:M1 family metallopeptidase [Novosphingobium album (ex Hu et al. 2023)]MCJ2178642.1 M1 family metallopeptidase [Novosphingobium album (ex Hu et al. 2023)]
MGSLRCLFFLALLFAILPAAVRAQATSADSAPVPEEITVLPGHVLPLGRLGDDVVPQAYRLDLIVDPAAARFSGHAEIDVRLARAQGFVDLHGRGLSVSRAVAQVAGRSIAGHWQQRDPTGVVRLTFDDVLPAGPVTLAFDYSAAFADGPAGMFHVEVEKAWYSWTQFESIDARAAFPCFDQPGFKTPFTITLRTPPGLKAISNGPAQGPPETVDGHAVHRFAPTLPLPTYLVAMMVGPFASLEGTVPPNGLRPFPLPVRIDSTQQNAGKLAFAMAGTREIVGLLEEYFGEPFPFPKLDQVTTPILPGAMENAGADLYRDDILVMDASAPVVQQRDFGVIVGHELGHQWFGDLVTPAWWDDIWLNESFANWIGYRIGDAWRPDLGIMGDALSDGFRAMETDALLAGRPVRQPIETNTRIDSAFDSITYGKGGHIVGMVAAWLGEDKFREGVRRFIAAHRFGAATSDDFFAALADAAGDPRLVEAMRSFVEQQGVPLLAMRQQGDKVTITQLRYTTAGVAPPDSLWIIPLCLRRGAVRRCLLMDQRTQAFTMPGMGPVFPNAGGTGYYRFELTARHWAQLISEAGTLPGGEAQALVDSLSASIRAGRGTIAEMARLGHKLIRHPDPHAADAPDRALSQLVNDGMVSTQGRRMFRLYRERLYTNLLRQYGFDPRAGVYAYEAPARSQRRIQIVAAMLGTGRGKDLRHQLAEAAKAYLAGDKAALDPAWLDHALDVYLFEGKEAATRGLVEKALNSEDPVFRPTALRAAARTSSKDLASWLLTLDDPRLRESEKREFLDGIMARSATRELGYDWALANVDRLLASSDGQFFSARLPQALGRFCSVAWASRIAQDFQEKLAGTAGALELDRAIERVRNCGLLEDMMGEQIDGEFLKLR